MAVSSLLKGFGSSAPSARKADPLRVEVLEDFEQAGMGWFWASDAEGRLCYLSDKAVETLCDSSAAIIGQPLVELFEIDRTNPDEKSDRPLNFLLSTKAKLKGIIVRVTGKAGTPAWWSLTGFPKTDEDGDFRGYRGSARDVTAEFKKKLEDSRMAEFDALTGLANRHRMDRKLNSTLAAYKSAKRSCALMLLDLDKFKYVNDTMGHPAGDDLLRQVAERLRAVAGDKAEIGRLGGDEFQLILPDIDDRGELGELADKIIQMLSSPYQVEGKRAIIGASVGISIAPYDGIESDELVRSADLALYAAKNGGRGMYRFYSAELKDVEQERQIILDDLRDALTDGQLKLHYQPVVRTKDHTVVGFEALMRWEHPDKGMIPPMHFIPVAEDSDLINRLGEWAIRRACEDAMEWPDSIRVAVNVSAKQFANKGFAAIVTQVLADTGIKPDRLELEMTETVFMGDSEATEATFNALKSLGVRLALDDFGTGYSSLSYLRSAPFDKLKVDKSFVDSCTQKDQNSAKIISAIIGLSNALGMDVTVEGVEAFDQFNLVCEKGAKYIQGWIYSKARPQDEILEEIASGGYRIKPSGPDQYRPERRSVFRRIGIIHDDHRYDAVMRDLSKTGSRIEGLVGVPEGTGLVLDMGGGQLAVCSVVRSEDATIGVEFETPLISDGAGGLCTRHRISPYALAAAGMPLGSLPPGNYPDQMLGSGPRSQPQFMQVKVSRS
ncbi:putative bifunctional diguanylate cyclase/phosphodiesterase [Aurantiacibacter gangjinensis]|uniref:Diguanylate phosphodiesterase n=1 Tax=Aurantiacibacter gangjinensis TaxID=502682 RepID=A0A0G9MUT1_9SPHN|nr:EAL domain-containing protein [Aurantiacibacter gangjinensis]APE28959.1 diguanylate cyclase/phosphodiesterase (GGDEF & EAL domains) with PAS/PAC sensor(s) [Aurantiacibacter gangjinensis]KLE33078.1 diguanylate phosphodiesterase [Aurantiacibacter gangjinensis]